MSRVEHVLGRIQFARNYSLRLLERIGPEEWFRQPNEGVTHLAWQMGHLAIAQYRLALERVRGVCSGDGELISQDFLTTFGKNSVPVADPGAYPTVSEIRTVFDRVHALVLRELPSLTDDVLDKPPIKPHDLFTTKLGALEWCAQHEMLHAGQIGLLRRLLGNAPLW